METTRFVCALLLTIRMKCCLSQNSFEPPITKFEINEQTCYRAPVTVLMKEYFANSSLEFQIVLNMQQPFLIYNESDSNYTEFSSACMESTCRHSFPTNNARYYVSHIRSDLEFSCDLKLAVAFTDDSDDSAAENAVAASEFLHAPCVGIKSLPCEHEPTLSVTYNGTVDGSASGVRIILCREGTVVTCADPKYGGQNLAWFYGNNTEIIKDPAVTVTKSMDGENIYCKEIVPYAKNSSLTLARSKTYTVQLVTEAVNGETCPHRAPVTVKGLREGESLTVTFSLNVTTPVYLTLFNKHGNNSINSGITIQQQSQTFTHPVVIEGISTSYYVSVLENQTKQCDLKLAIVFTNDSTSSHSISRDYFKSTPCVRIDSLPCRSEPTLSITYNGVVHESASSDNAITYSGPTLVYCNGPSDAYFMWYNGNDTALYKGPAVTITKYMDGANVYCAEIATCNYGADLKNNCTLARSKIYTLNFVKNDGPTLTVAVKKEGDKEILVNGNVKTIEFRGYNSYLKCLNGNASKESDQVSWYDGNHTLLVSSRTIFLKKGMDGLTVFCEIKPNYAEVAAERACNDVARSHAYTLRFVDSAPPETKLTAPTTATPYVCPILSAHYIRNITLAGALLDLYIINQPHGEFDGDYTVSLERDQVVLIKCTSKELQNARINIYYKKRIKGDFECADNNQIDANNTYEEVVCVSIRDKVPLNRSAFVHISNTSITPATSTSKAYSTTATSLAERTTALGLDTNGGPGTHRPVGLWAGAAVAGALVLAALVCAIHKWRQNRAKRRRSNFVLEDQLYSTSGQVQYAELQIKSAPSRILSNEENCPYAQIIGVMAPE